MITQTIDLDYCIDEDTIVDRCLIDLPSDHDAQQIHCQYIKTCRDYFRAMMLSGDYPDYPAYFKEPFEPLFSPPDEQNPEGVFDLDRAFDILNQMLDEHVHCFSDSIQLIGSALQDSYNFFEELLSIAVTSNLFPVKQFVVESNDYEASGNHWVTIYECHDGKVKSVYCSG